MRTALLGSKGTTLDLLHQLEKSATVSFDKVFSIPRTVAEKNEVAYYRGEGIRDFCRSRGIPHHMTETYTLKTENDAAALTSIDLLVVIGWERLLPAQILNGLGFGAAGMHGSAFGLPRGRGRSPMNWALITGERKFVTSLFKYEPGMDDGPIIGTKIFDINPHDDIARLHAKNRICMGALLEENAPMIASGTVTLSPQPDTTPTFYPKRTRGDGRIDWHMSTEDICRLVRAVAAPYPGALAYLHGREIVINAAAPFDSGLFTTAIPPGTIVDVIFSTGDLVVKTATGSLIATDFEGVDVQDVAVGDKFSPFDHRETLRAVRARYPKNIRDDQKEI